MALAWKVRQGHIEMVLSVRLSICQFVHPSICPKFRPDYNN